MVRSEYPRTDDVYLLEQNHLLRADYRPTGAGVCAFRAGAKAQCRDGDHAVYALFGAHWVNAFQHFYRLHLFVHRQHLCGRGRDVRCHEPVWLHHQT
ncbi:hypothetical protein D3C71_1625980 [compost metagenome]